jgi:hypothetical protein
MELPLIGGCQCGAVRYACDTPPSSIYVCHCLECRKQSASAFGISVMVPVAALRLTVGRTQSWVRIADSGNRLRCHFCSQCGSRLWHQADGRERDILSIKGGSLDQPIDLADAVHIWVSRKLSGVIVPQGAQQFPGEPP